MMFLQYLLHRCAEYGPGTGFYGPLINQSESWILQSTINLKISMHEAGQKNTTGNKKTPISVSMSLYFTYVTLYRL